MGGRASLLGLQRTRYPLEPEADLNSLFISAFQSQPVFHFNGRVRLGAPLSALSGAAHSLLKAVLQGVEQIMVLTPALGKSCPVATPHHAAARPRSDRPAAACC